MNIELLATICGTTITIVTLGLTIYLTNKSTQKIIKEGQENTQKILLENSKLLERIAKIQEDTHRCLIKIDKGLMANALMHGWLREDNISPERIAEIPEPKVYDEKLGFCYYKSATK